MNNKLPKSTDVLIVGAGPAGMTLAISLKQLGVDCVVIDQLPSPPDDTRAAFVQPRTLDVRFEFDEDALPSYDMLGGYTQLASERRFTVPVARTFSLEDWRTAAELSQSGRARGKLVLGIS